jgi:predicted permease
VSAFFETFLHTFLSVGKIGLVVLAGGILVRLKIVTQGHVTALSDTTVYVFLPCLMFSNIVTHFDPLEDSYWWVLPMLSIGMVSVGLVLTAALFWRSWKSKANLLPLGAIQNAGYMVLPLGEMLAPEEFERFSVYVFLYILVHNPLIWTVGKALIGRGHGTSGPFRWRELITPPLVANLLALTLVFSGFNAHLPGLLLEPIHLLGTATVPVATFVTGASLGGIHLTRLGGKADLFKVLSVKLILIPLAMILVLHAIGLKDTNALLALFLIIEGSVGPATSLILAVRTYGGDLQKVSVIVFYSYVVSLLTIPLWISIWKIL